MVGDLTEIGLWLIGVGSLAVVIAIVFGAERPEDGGAPFMGPLTSTRERLVFAAEGAGLAHAAVGALFVAICEFPEWWVALVSAVSIVALTYALLVWKQYQHRRSRLEDSRRDAMARPEPDDSELAWQEQCLERCATLRWALAHPFADKPWPDDCFRLPGAPPRK